MQGYLDKRTQHETKVSNKTLKFVKRSNEL